MTCICKVCGYRFSGSEVFWSIIYLSEIGRRRWPRRKRVYIECPECRTLAMTQDVTRDVMEILA